MVVVVLLLLLVLLVRGWWTDSQPARQTGRQRTAQHAGPLLDCEVTLVLLANRCATTNNDDDGNNRQTGSEGDRDGEQRPPSLLLYVTICQILY